MWFTDQSGNYLSSAFDTASGTSTALQSLEPSFHQDLNGDGVIGLATADSSPHFVYEGIDADGAQLYDVTWNTSGLHPFAVRVLTPDHPSTNYQHSFLYALPVEAGLAQSTYGSGLHELQQLDVQNQYNATIIEPIFPIDSWYADNPNDTSIDFETFMATFLPTWVESHFSTTGTEENLLIGFSKSGYGALDLLLKHPDVFNAAAAWDFPGDMTAYDTFGSSSSADYGTEPISKTTIGWIISLLTLGKGRSQLRIGSGFLRDHVFQNQVADFDALLTSDGVLHTLGMQTNDAHNWYGGWLSAAVTGLYGLV